MSRGARSARRAAKVASRPVRTCVACRDRAPQDTLLRMTSTVTSEGRALRLDAADRAPGRGAYLCPRTACIERAVARDANLLRRVLRTTGPLDVSALRDTLRALSEDPLGTTSASTAATTATTTTTTREATARTASP